MGMVGLRHCDHTDRLLEDTLAPTRRAINVLEAVLYKKYMIYSQLTCYTTSKYSQMAHNQRDGRKARRYRRLTN